MILAQFHTLMEKSGQHLFWLCFDGTQLLGIPCAHLLGYTYEETEAEKPLALSPYGTKKRRWMPACPKE